MNISREYFFKIPRMTEESGDKLLQDPSFP